jgi:hypothetical protein
LKLLLLLLIVGFIGIGTAHGQTIEVIEGVTLETSQVLVIFGLGVMAGLFRAFINKKTKSKTDEPQKGQFTKNVLTCVLATIPLGFTAAMSVDINLMGYFVIFFASYGGGAALQNGGAAVQKIGQ